MNLYVLLGIAGVLILALVAIAILSKRNSNRNDEFIKAQKKNTKNYMRGFTKMFEHTPVLRRYYNQVKSRYQSLFPADEITIETYATKTLLKGIGIFAGLVIAMVFICNGRLAYILVGIVGAYILFTDMVNSSTDALERKLLEQLNDFIDDVTAYYHEFHDVGDAIEACLDDLPYEISLHAQRLHQIVTSTDPDYEMEEYIAVAPNQFLLLMAAVCSSISECGDKEIDGKSLFLMNLNYIKEQMDTERLNLIDRANAFYGKTMEVIAPLFLFRFAEQMLTKSISDVKSFYEGAIGTVVIAILMVIDIVCYELINIHKNTGKDMNESGTSEGFLKKMANKPLIKKFLVLKQNKFYTRALRETDMLNGTGSKESWGEYTLKRYVWAFAMFMLVFLVSLYSCYEGRKYTFKDFSSAFSQSLVPSEEYRQTMQDISLQLTGEIKEADDVGVIVDTFIEDNNYDEDMADDITAELESRLDEYNKYHYRWWMLLIGIGASVLGYYIPAFLLKKKAEVMQLKRASEVNQFKTLIMILMHMDGMMLDEVLVWMERFAKVYKTALSQCIMNYEWSQTGALEELKENEKGFAPFKRLCDSLLSVDAVGLENAFGGLESDREFENKRIEKEQAALLVKESKKVNFIASIPLSATVIGYILLPFGIYAINMATQFTGIF